MSNVVGLYEQNHIQMFWSGPHQTQIIGYNRGIQTQQGPDSLYFMAFLVLDELETMHYG